MAVARSVQVFSQYVRLITGIIERNGGDVRLSRVLTESRIWPMFTRATVPLGLPHAPRIPVCSLSAPAHDNILLMRTTW